MPFFHSGDRALSATFIKMWGDRDSPKVLYRDSPVLICATLESKPKKWPVSR